MLFRNHSLAAGADNNSAEELEWDEYGTQEGLLPPPSADVSVWQPSTDEEKAQVTLFV